MAEQDGWAAAIPPEQIAEEGTTNLPFVPGAVIGWRTAVEAGLLHHINETALWPMGLSLVVTVVAETANPDHRDYATARVGLRNTGEALITGLSEDDHGQLHDRLRAFMLALAPAEEAAYGVTTDPGLGGAE